MEIADMTRLSLALIALWLGGCAAAPGGAGIAANYEGLAAGGPEKAHDINSRDLLVRIPDWTGAVQRARQYEEGGVLRQEIVFAGGTRGDHLIEVAVATRVTGSEVLHQPSDAEIQDELAAKFPGVTMRVVTAPSPDASGPERIAIGRANDGTRCLYAWRWSDAVRVASDPSGIATIAAIFSQKAMPASLRIRLCTKYVSLDDLASLAGQIRFASVADIDRIVAGPTAAADPPARAETGALTPTLESALACPGATPSTARFAQASAPAEKRPAHHIRASQTAVAYPTFQGGGQRFLAPPRSDASAVKTLGQSVTRKGDGPQGLDLPAAAFRGPAAAGSATWSSGSQTPQQATGPSL
jgi:Cellulose biosynthesis protein BcsN